MLTNLRDYQSRHDTTTPFSQLPHSQQRDSRRGSYEEPLDDGLPDVFKEDLETQRQIRALPSCESIAGPHRKNLRYPGRRAKSTPPIVSEPVPDFNPSTYGSRLGADSTGQRRPLAERIDYVAPTNSEDLKPRTAPENPTRIPKAFWKTEPLLGGIVNSGGAGGPEPLVVWDEDHNAFHTIIFPSAHPSTRREVNELTRVFDSLFSDTETAAERVNTAAAQGDATQVLQVMVPQVRAVDAVFHESCRQVSTTCSQRGSLMSKVQKQQERLNQEMLFTIGSLGEYIGKLEHRQRAQAKSGDATDTEDSAVMQEKLMSMVNSLLEERDALTQRLGTLEGQLRSTEATVEQLMKDARPAMITDAMPAAGSTFFQTQQGSRPSSRWEPAKSSEREKDLQGKCDRLEAELRTMQLVVESHAQMDKQVDEQRLELRSMDNTTRELVAHLDHLKAERAAS